MHVADHRGSDFGDDGGGLWTWGRFAFGEVPGLNRPGIRGGSDRFGAASPVRTISAFSIRLGLGFELVVLLGKVCGHATEEVTSC